MDLALMIDQKVFWLSIFFVCCRLLIIPFTSIYGPLCKDSHTIGALSPAFSI
ncbi:hypothetical protein BJY04DRAFT_203472, partial [Aspergillus karnatakaensis]|uniref:uncharacterized protein n=1 Tax=Aspergillus karnatakaensis TaxID=1810916 RepID=UPI003CCD8572